ncbi:phosphoribosyltransferase [Candidatus Bathyarchaeota archaeon]|nr:phosphoribosyltransferase [Candidatus Bathyarchaeota archaeon]
MLLRLARKIKESSFTPEIIVGVSRGGWPPARILSDLLDNPNLANVKVEFYVGVAETAEKPSLTQPVSTDVAGKKVLIVDEVADTGKSLQVIHQHLLDRGAEEVKIATIYCKPWSLITPDYYVKMTDRWIVFPWEIRETIKKLVKKCQEKGESIDKELERLVKAGLSKKVVDYLLKDVLEEGKC